MNFYLYHGSVIICLFCSMVPNVIIREAVGDTVRRDAVGREVIRREVIRREASRLYGYGNDTDPYMPQKPTNPHTH